MWILQEKGPSFGFLSGQLEYYAQESSHSFSAQVLQCTAFVIHAMTVLIYNTLARVCLLSIQSMLLFFSCDLLWLSEYAIQYFFFKKKKSLNMYPLVVICTESMCCHAACVRLFKLHINKKSLGVCC